MKQCELPNQHVREKIKYLRDEFGVTRSEFAEFAQFKYDIMSKKLAKDTPDSIFIQWLDAKADLLIAMKKEERENANK